MQTIFKPVILLGCEIVSIILREEQSLRVAEKRLQKKIFVPKRDEI
jgi:hypothetical protein